MAYIAFIILGRRNSISTLPRSLTVSIRLLSILIFATSRSVLIVLFLISSILSKLNELLGFFSEVAVPTSLRSNIYHHQV
ncbi:hypothetical protein LguiA_020457 [Lonicera macranthoides]